MSVKTLLGVNVILDESLIEESLKSGTVDP